MKTTVIPSGIETWARGPFAAIWLGYVVLIAISPLLASGSLSASSLRSMLPFAAILVVASIGQTLVVQQRGFDLSVPGTIALSAVIITHVPGGDNGKIAMGLLVTLGAAVAIGLVNGLAVSRFGISPIVATLAMNAILLGLVLQVSEGSPRSSADNLSGFAIDRTFGVPNTVFVAAGFVAVAWVITKKTVVGRRFETVGSNPRAANAVGIPVRHYIVGTYVAASVCYAAAGVLLAAFLHTPSIFSGNTYLFATVAVVVLAGVPLTGGPGSVVSTAIAALFLTQLQTVVMSRGSDIAIQYVIQGLAIGIGMGLRNVPWRRVLERLGRMSDPGAATPISRSG